MILFSKTIDSVQTINFLTTEQQKTYNRNITKFSNFIQSLGVDNSENSVTTLTEVETILSNFSVTDKSGVLINFIGHGNEFGIGDNNGFFIYWQELLPTFQTINLQNNIILNTSLMCKGNGVFSLSNSVPKPYYAAFGTNTSTDAKSYYLTESILKRCLTSNNILNSIATQNNQIRDNELGFEELTQNIRELGNVVQQHIITQFSHCLT